MKRRLIRWGVPLLITIVVLSGALFMVKHWETSSSTGTVKVGNPNTEIQPMQPLNIDSVYFHTLLPAGFVLKRQNETPTADQTMLQLVADSSGTVDEQFAATVRIMPIGGLAEVGDYNLRVKNTAAYVPFHPITMPAGAKAFRTISGGPAFTVFWPHGSQYIELAFSSDGGATFDQLQALNSKCSPLGSGNNILLSILKRYISEITGVEWVIAKLRYIYCLL